MEYFKTCEAFIPESRRVEYARQKNHMLVESFLDFIQTMWSGKRYFTVHLSTKKSVFIQRVTLLATNDTVYFQCHLLARISRLRCEKVQRYIPRNSTAGFTRVSAMHLGQTPRGTHLSQKVHHPQPVHLQYTLSGRNEPPKQTRSAPTGPFRRSNAPRRTKGSKRHLQEQCKINKQ